MNPASPLAALLAGALVVTLWAPTLAPVAPTATAAAATTSSAPVVA